MERNIYSKEWVIFRSNRSSKGVDAAVSIFFFWISNIGVIILTMIVSNMPFRLASINNPTRILRQ